MAARMRQGYGVTWLAVVHWMVDGGRTRRRITLARTWYRSNQRLALQRTPVPRSESMQGRYAAPAAQCISRRR
jgi:hypothetical protein